MTGFSISFHEFAGQWLLPEQNWSTPIELGDIIRFESEESRIGGMTENYILEYEHWNWTRDDEPSTC